MPGAGARKAGRRVAHVLFAEHDAACRAVGQAHERLQQRGLAGAVAAEHGEDAALVGASSETSCRMWLRS